MAPLLGHLRGGGSAQKNWGGLRGQVRSMPVLGEGTRARLPASAPRALSDTPPPPSQRPQPQLQACCLPPAYGFKFPAACPQDGAGTGTDRACPPPAARWLSRRWPTLTPAGLGIRTHGRRGPSTWGGGSPGVMLWVSQEQRVSLEGKGDLCRTCSDQPVGTEPGRGWGRGDLLAVVRVLGPCQTLPGHSRGRQTPAPSAGWGRTVSPYRPSCVPKFFGSLLTPGASEGDYMWTTGLGRGGRSNRRSPGWVLVLCDRGPHQQRTSGHRWAERDNRVGAQGGDGHLHTQRRGLRSNQPCDTWDWDSSVRGGDCECLLCKSPAVGPHQGGGGDSAAPWVAFQGGPGARGGGVGGQRRGLASSGC